MPRLPSTAAVAFVAVGFVGAVSVAVLLIHPSPETPPTPAERRAREVHDRLHRIVDPLVQQGELAAAMKHFDTFPVSLLNTPTGRKVQEERQALLKRIHERFSKAWAGIIRLEAEGKHRETLSRLEEMLAYAVGDLRERVLEKRRRILEIFETRARAHYHRVFAGTRPDDPAFLKDMVARDFSSALNRMLDLVGSGPIPKDLQRERFRLEGFDYDRLQAAADAADLDLLMDLVEPRLVLVRTPLEMDTPHLILFDILCGAYGASLLRAAREGLEYFRRDGAWLQWATWKNREGKPERSGGGWQVRFRDRTTCPIDPRTLALQDLFRLASRGSDPDPRKAVSASMNDSRLLLKMGVVSMYTPGDENLALAHTLFERAATPLQPPPVLPGSLRTLSPPGPWLRELSGPPPANGPQNRSPLSELFLRISRGELRARPAPPK